MQDILLEELHKEHKINFIGRSSYSDAREAEILNFLYGRKKEINNLNIFEKNKLNVLSEEMLSLVMCMKDGIEEFLTTDEIIENILKLKNILENFFKEDVEIEILVTLRNQVSLLESLYIELYGWCFRLIHDFSTVEKFISSLEDNKYSIVFDSFNFYKVVSKYDKFFKINILLYEDLLNQNEEFFAILSALLNVDNNIVKESFTQKVNTKIKKGDKYVVKIGLSYYLASLLYKIGIINLYFRIRNISFIKNIAQKSLNLLSKVTVNEYQIRPFTEEEREKIFNFYKDSNILLSKKFNLDMSKLEKYGYV